MFHHIKGENITLEQNGNIATWMPKQSGGCAFPRQPLGSGPILLTFEGSGAIELGVVSRDPETLRAHALDACMQLPGYQFLNDVKIHKRACKMEVRLDYNMCEVTSTYGAGHYKQKIHRDQRYWLVLDLKYGNVEVKLVSTEGNQLSFSDVHGHNVKVLNNPSILQTVDKSPAAFCFYGQPLENGHRITLQCMPKTHQGTVPGRRFIRLFLSKTPPGDIKRSYNGYLNMAVPKTKNKLPLVEIETFEKDHCTGGPISLDFNNDVMTYQSSLGKTSQQPCVTRPDKWLVLQIYGMSVQLNCGQLTSLDDRCSTPDEAADGDTFLKISNQGRDLVCSGGQSTGSDEHFYDQVDQAPEDGVYLQNAIQKSWTKLLTQFSPTEFIDLMYENSVITFTEMDHLTHAQANTLPKQVLFILSRKPVSKKFMVRSLEKTGQKHLLPYFFPDENEKE